MSDFQALQQAVTLDEYGRITKHATRPLTDPHMRLSDRASLVPVEQPTLVDLYTGNAS